MEAWVITLIILAAALILILGVFIAFYYLKKKQNKSIVNPDFIAALLLYLGGNNNILKVEFEQSRLKIEVNELYLVDLEKLKTLTDKGIFVTGNIIKALFKDEAINIKNALEKR